MRILIPMFFVLLMNQMAVANGGEFAVANIPDSLKKNANVVKRIEEERFTLKNPGEAIYYHRYAITVLNENGDNYAQFIQSYDRFFEIRSIEGSLYDANGVEIKKLKSKDIQDLSGVDGGSLMTDDRVKVHHFYYKVYPYTVEYTLELKYNGTMFYPDWRPMPAELYSVQQSKFVFECPLTYEFRFKAFNYSGSPQSENLSDKKRFTWEVKGQPAIIKELFSPSFSDFSTHVIFGPTEFEMQGYKGNMKSWQDFGRFIYSLKLGRDELPADIKQKVHSIADGIADPKEKIRALYEYMQKNTRYVSIQLGIGGWQPFEAKYVAGKGYGDCKALTNYMYSLLKEAGITSHYAVIKAGRGNKTFFGDFPFSQFNHAILCVPLPNDTTWLECTSQTVPAGYMGRFTDDRFALVIDENGGKLVQTPKYVMKDNLQKRMIRAKLDTEGMLVTDIHTKYTGIQQDELHKLINSLSKEKVKEYLHEELELATYTVNSFDYKEKKGTLPEIEESLSVSADHYATISGKRMFIVPNIMTRSPLRLNTDEERKLNIRLDYEYIDLDNVEIEIPAGYKPESIPQDALIDSKFGKYKATVKVEANKIIYSRSMEQYSGLFPKTDYTQMVNFYEAIYKADRNKLVFVKTAEEVKKPF